MTETEKKEAMKDPKTRLSQKYDLVINTKKGTPENDKAMEDYLNERDEVKRELGLKEVTKLASNENPYGCSEKAKEAIIKWLAMNAQYSHTMI